MPRAAATFGSRNEWIGTPSAGSQVTKPVVFENAYAGTVYEISKACF